MSAHRLVDLLREAKEQGGPRAVSGVPVAPPTAIRVASDVEREAFGGKGVGYKLDTLIASLDNLSRIARSGVSRFLEGPDEVPGVKARFLKPSEEDTRTWGNSTSLSFVGSAVGELVNYPSTQLLHVSRKRPTTFLVTTVVVLGNGWQGESTGWTVFNTIIAGVGQTQAPVQRTLPLDPLIAALPLQYAGQISQVVDSVQLPANALQCNLTLASTQGPINDGPHDVLVTVIAAPIYA